MSAELYGFRLEGIEAVPILDFCRRVTHLSETPFRLHGRQRFPLVVADDDWLLTTIMSNRPREATPVLEESEGKAQFKIVPGKELPKVQACTCIAFCKRRHVGVVATYRGGVSILQVCHWLASEYRKMAREKRDELLKDVASGSLASMTQAQVKERFKMRKRVRCVPLHEKATIERRLKDLVSVAEVIVSVPMRENDPVAPIQNVASETQMVIKIETQFRQTRTWWDKIGEIFGHEDVSSPKVKGKDASGRNRTIALAIDVLQLAPYQKKKLIDAAHMQAHTMLDAPIFSDLKEFVSNNPRLFGR